MRTLSQVGSRKPLISIDKQETCKEALSQMAQHHVHHLAVTENNDPIGILSDRDILFRWVRGPFVTRDEFDNLPIHPLVRTHLPVVTEKTSLSETLGWMRNLGTSALLSYNSSKHWSIITETDLLLALDSMVKNKNWRHELIAETESELASPLVQKLVENLVQMGL